MILWKIQPLFMVQSQQERKRQEGIVAVQCNARNSALKNPIILLGNLQITERKKANLLYELFIQQTISASECAIISKLGAREIKYVVRTMRHLKRNRIMKTIFQVKFAFCLSMRKSIWTHTHTQQAKDRFGIISKTIWFNETETKCYPICVCVYICRAWQFKKFHSVFVCPSWELSCCYCQR